MEPVDDNGNWTFTPDTPLSDGVHNLTLTQTDAAGNVSAETSLPTFTVDTTAPAGAVISAVNLEGTTVTGRAEAGSLVTIIGSNNRVLGAKRSIKPAISSSRFPLTDARRSVAREDSG